MVSASSGSGSFSLSLVVLVDVGGGLGDGDRRLFFLFFFFGGVVCVMKISALSSSSSSTFRTCLLFFVREGPLSGLLFFLAVLDGGYIVLRPLVVVLYRAGERSCFLPGPRQQLVVFVICVR